jgi:hypothetical protein
MLAGCRAILLAPSFPAEHVSVKRVQNLLVLFMLVAIVLVFVLPQVNFPKAVFNNNVANPIRLRCQSSRLPVAAVGVITAASDWSFGGEQPQRPKAERWCDRHSLLDLICVLLC